jgi:ubiquinone/menaquinone biosynthesis C-methylase UbiE
MTMADQQSMSADPAIIYEKCFVPALFAPWAERVADAAALQAGDRVLDVACGTGVLARAAAQRVEANGHAAVTGLDVNEGMLRIAQQVAPELEWRQGRAESLPFADGTFDAVVSQFGLMFFENREAAAREMMRILRTRGRFALAVWDDLQHMPAYQIVVRLLRREFDDDVANLLRTPFSLGDPDELRALLQRNGLSDAKIDTQSAPARFPSIRQWMATDIRGWVEFSRPVDDAALERLISHAETELSQFVRNDGSVEFEMRAHIATGRRG